MAPYDDNHSVNDSDKSPDTNNQENTNYDDNNAHEAYVGVAAVMNAQQEEHNSDQENDFH